MNLPTLTPLSVMSTVPPPVLVASNAEMVSAVLGTAVPAEYPAKSLLTTLKLLPEAVLRLVLAMTDWPVAVL